MVSRFSSGNFQIFVALESTTEFLIIFCIYSVLNITICLQQEAYPGCKNLLWSSLIIFFWGS